MRLLAPLFALLLPCLAVQAEESVSLPLLQTSSGTPQPSTTPNVELQQQLKLMQTERDQLQAQLQEQKQKQLEEQKQLQESAQVSRLRQENQRLKLQLKAAQAGQPARWLSEQQTWFALGSALALIALIIGRLSAGLGKSRKHWLN